MDIEEDIKILNEYINIDRKMRNNNQESDYDKFCERQCIAIENLLAKREEDKKKIAELEKENHKILENGLDVIRDMIPKQKVKDKIKEIQEDKESQYYYMFLESRDIEKVVDILEELLEDK